MPANATATCNGTSCGYTCNAGFHDCGGGNCLADTSTGSCGTSCTACPVPANSASICNAGLCDYNCTAPYGDCNNLAGDGCEINLSADVNNCGLCARACMNPGNATPICTGGSCNYTCLAGYADCDMALVNGCEASLLSTANCGACMVACPGGTPRCQLAGSTYSCVACGAGETYCSDSNSCTDLTSDPNNCGMCGMQCPVLMTCVASACIMP